MTSSIEIFKAIDLAHKQGDFKFDEAANTLSDLAYVIMPFNQQAREFRLLISTIKKTLDSTQGGLKLYNLVDAVLRLKLNTFDEAIRQKIDNGDYSRTSKDISVLINFSCQKASEHQEGSMGRELWLKMISERLLNELRFLSLNDLQAEQISYLSEAFSILGTYHDQADEENSQLSEQHIKLVTDFIPKLIDHTQIELYRFRVSDLVKLLHGFEKLWDSGLLPDKQLTRVHNTSQAYLDNYLHKAQKIINGKEFSMLLKQMAFAKKNNICDYDKKTLYRMEQIFIADNTESGRFSASELYSIFQSFETLQTYHNQQKVYEIVQQEAMECMHDSDADFLALYKMFHANGMLEADEESKLCVFLQQYMESKFEFMEKDEVFFQYLEFLKELGLWYWNTTLIEQIQAYFAENYYTFGMNELCRLFRLLSYNFDKNDEFITLIEDSIKIRLSHAIKSKEPLNVSVEGMLALTEGLSVLGQRRPRLLALLKRILVEEDSVNAHSTMFCKSGRLLVQTASLFSDYEVPVAGKLAQMFDRALLEVHVPVGEFKVQEYSHLALCGGTLSEECMEVVRKECEERVEGASQAERERMALAFGIELDGEVTSQQMKETADNSNLTEILENQFQTANLKLLEPQVLGGRLKANFITENASGDRHIIEIVEEDMAHYTKEGQTEMRQRGRLAEKVAQDAGYAGYSCISYIELEYALDEREILEHVIARACNF